jgi:hypothetical protein
VLGDLAPPTQLPSHNFAVVNATAVTTKPVFARVDFSSLLAHVRCGASLSANVASLIDATQYIAAAVNRQVQRADSASSALPRPPAARPQTGVSHGRPSVSTVHATVRPHSSTQARPASASISHLLSQPASFSSFVKEARRHRYEDAAASAATPAPMSRPRTGQLVTFQPSALASTNQLEDALASNILRYKGSGSGHQPAPATVSENLAAIASRGHQPPLSAVQRLNRPRDASPRSAFVEASRPPVRLDAARSSRSAVDMTPIVPQPPLEKPTAAKRAPTRRAVSKSSPIKQREQHTSVKDSAAELPRASAEGPRKKKTKVRKRAPVTVEVSPSAINVFSLDTATPMLNSAGAFLKPRHH